MLVPQVNSAQHIPSLPVAVAYPSVSLDDASAGRCGRAMCAVRRVAEPKKFVVVTCSAACRIVYHFPECWKPVLHEYKKAGCELTFGGACLTPDCHGALQDVCLKHGAKTLKALVSAPERDKEGEPSLKTNISNREHFQKTEGWGVVPQDRQPGFICKVRSFVSCFCCVLPLHDSFAHIHHLQLFLRIPTPFAFAW